MYSLRGIAYRFFQANKFTVLSAIISIAIAAIFVMTMLLYSLSAHEAMEEQIKNLYGDTDLSVAINLEQEKVVIPQMEDPFVQDNLHSLTIYLVVISFLVVMVTGFLINSNFELLLYKMTNQFAIMRSLGASSKQLGKLVFFQGIGINIAGVLLGFVTTLALILPVHVSKIFQWVAGEYKPNGIISPSKNTLVIMAIMSR